MGVSPQFFFEKSVFEKQSTVDFLLLMEISFESQVLSQRLMDQPPLGHKEPRPNRQRLHWCPGCVGMLALPVKLTSRHTLISYSFV